MQVMKITEIQITPIKPKEGLVAFASVVLDDDIYLGFIGIHTKLDGTGYRLTYPTKKVGEKSLNIFYPLNKEASKELEKAIIEKAEKMFNAS
jgi:stage V sporulation protein G